MACYGAIALIWRIKLCEILAMACAPIGAAFTASSPWPPASHLGQADVGHLVGLGPAPDLANWSCCSSTSA
jgi:hypothetical protein